MSTRLRNVTDTMSQTRFWGGQERGVCVQVTQTGLSDMGNCQNGFGSVQVNRQQAALLAQELLLFANENEVEDLDGGLQ